MQTVGPVVGFYGDDFTGSSENLAQFHRSGLKTRLFLKMPSADELKKATRGLDVVGFAGTARALSNRDIVAEVSPAFEALRSLGCRFLQYKICSTFDSAPDVGNFGYVAEHMMRDGESLAVLAATPDFGRYTAFGNHYARFGKDILRLDRHPSMSNHPRTPMAEADLREHLRSLCSLPFVNVLLPDLRNPALLAERLEAAAHRGEGAIFDGVDNEDLELVSAALWDSLQARPVFALAAQGLAQLLGKRIARERSAADLVAVSTTVSAARNLLVLSGSCAIQTGRQIDVAEKQGWALLEVNPTRLKDDSDVAQQVEALKPLIAENIARCRPTVVYTARGNEMDRSRFEDVPPQLIGACYARLMIEARKEADVQRIVLAGGDSSSYAMRSSDASSLTIKVFDGEQHGHLCELMGGGLDGLEVLLKGGQVGDDDYLLRMLNGTETRK
ncbi:four-carbon acid sugar kinase family protein [Pararhizobium arenae]|uniref:four-carbon acid sugar kinase family protein n=1 Tax=Pararhizobium arenae TaxID=1856850 RepID=UPI00094AE0FA|nr:four-carbon acid sugar kinase family protein [Pararhizobium arenae]